MAKKCQIFFLFWTIGLALVTTSVTIQYSSNYREIKSFLILLKLGKISFGSFSFFLLEPWGNFFSAVRPDAFSHLKRYCVKITDQGWLSAVKLN